MQIFLDIHQHIDGPNNVINAIPICYYQQQESSNASVGDSQRYRIIGNVSM